MENVKPIKLNKPMPENIRKAIENKKEWVRKIQSGEMRVPDSKQLKRFA
jgi:hypothetical protein